MHCTSPACSPQGARGWLLPTGWLLGDGRWLLRLLRHHRRRFRRWRAGLWRGLAARLDAKLFERDRRLGCAPLALILLLLRLALAATFERGIGDLAAEQPDGADSVV